MFADCDDAPFDIRQFCRELLAGHRETRLRFLPDDWVPSGELPDEPAALRDAIVRRAMIESVECEFAALSAFREHERAAREAAEPRVRRGRSVVFGFRLPHDELEALEREAHRLGMRPSALARNLVRAGVHGGYEGARMGAALARVEQAMSELRTLVPTAEAFDRGARQ